MFHGYVSFREGNIWYLYSLYVSIFNYPYITYMDHTSNFCEDKGNTPKDTKGQDRIIYI